jgi:F0F1-type ATP synthase membrane subunit b/b'
LRYLQFYFLLVKTFLGSLLEERKTTIVKGVQDAEDRLNEAKRLSEAENN